MVADSAAALQIGRITLRTGWGVIVLQKDAVKLVFPGEFPNAEPDAVKRLPVGRESPQKISIRIREVGDIVSRIDKKTHFPRLRREVVYTVKLCLRHLERRAGEQYAALPLGVDNDAVHRQLLCVL